MKVLLPIVLLAITLSPDTYAESPEEKGRAIAEEIERRDRGWKDQRAVLVMTLRNRQGQESHRELHISTLEVDGDGDKSLTVFDSPRDVKGTAFLSHTHATEPDEQWLYLPALKRVKRISSRNKSGSFMGSEFAYEDISSQEVEKYRYEWLRDETLDGRQTVVVAYYPVYENSGYTRQVVWIDSEIMRPVKTEYYDRKDALLKILTVEDYGVCRRFKAIANNWQLQHSREHCRHVNGVMGEGMRLAAVLVGLAPGLEHHSQVLCGIAVVLIET